MKLENLSKTSLFFQGSIFNFTKYAQHDLRLRKQSSESFKELVYLVENLVKASVLKVERKVEKDFWCFDPREGREAYMDTRFERSAASESEYYERRERRFFNNFIPIAGRSGFRHVTRQEQECAVFSSFGQHRYYVNTKWLDESVLLQNYPNLIEGFYDTTIPAEKQVTYLERFGVDVFSKKEEETSVHQLHPNHHLNKKTERADDPILFNGVGMFVRGEGEVSTSGYFVLEKLEALQSECSSYLYFQYNQIFPSLAEFIDPDIDRWEDTYLKRKKLLLSDTDDILLHNTNTQLLNGRQKGMVNFLFFNFFRPCALKEETYRDVLVVFRRRRKRTSLETHSEWRTGGGVFNPRNIEIHHYVDVPKSDINLLVPERVARHKPLDYLTLTSSLCVLGWSLLKCVVAGYSLTLSQIALVVFATGYASRIAARWKANTVRYTSVMDALRDRNHKTTGTGTLQEVLKMAAEQMLLQAMVVYHVLVKHAASGVQTHMWSATHLERNCSKELELASNLDVVPDDDDEDIVGVSTRYGHTGSSLPPGELARKATCNDDIGGLGLWTFDEQINGEEGFPPLGLRPHTMDVATYAVRERWANLL